MTIELKVPTLPESISDATVAKWHKKSGDPVQRDETLLELETEKVMLEVPAPQTGVLAEIFKPEGSIVTVNEILGILNTSVQTSTSNTQPATSAQMTVSPSVAAPTISSAEAVLNELSPAVRRMVSEHGIDATQLTGSGKNGRITKEDIITHVEKIKTSQVQSSVANNFQPESLVLPTARSEKRVPMSRIRAKIAERLVEVQQTAAMLTTFNEVNLQAVMDLRIQYKDSFEKMHGVKLGFMSFFVKAAIEALKRYPIVNASLDGNDVVYHGYYDIGIAVSTARGLVVPILRDAETLSMAEIEKNILVYAEKARDAKLTLEEMQGGTFTITNGGIFGSMLSTPILNAPQSAILGMHNIVKRAVVENDEIVIRPMMYLALSYDHRLLDGRDSVGFLLTIKQLLEDPARFLLGV